MSLRHAAVDCDLDPAQTERGHSPFGLTISQALTGIKICAECEIQASQARPFSRQLITSHLAIYQASVRFVSFSSQYGSNKIVDNIVCEIHFAKKTAKSRNADPMPGEKIVKLSAVSSSAATAASDTNRLVSELRRRIVGHELPPGARLREHALSQEFAVSRGRVRDAFGILEERGLIERIPNKGAVVTRLEADRIQELFEVREFLEAAIVRLATERAAPETWDRLLDVFGEPLREAVADNDFDAYTAAISEFRSACIAAAENETLKDLLDSLYDRIQGMTRRLVLVPGRAMEGFRQHQEILRAMRDGDADRAERLKRENIRTAREWFQRYQTYLL